MNLHEYQAKKIFIQYGLPVPQSTVCSTIDEVEKFFVKNKNIDNGPWMLKCQIHAGGRGKSGGIKIIKSKDEALLFAKHWFGARLVTYQTDVCGQIVNKILIENYIDTKKELYLGMTIDRSKSRIICIASHVGGVDIEQISSQSFNKLHKILLDPLIKEQDYQGRLLGFKLGLKIDYINKFNEIFLNLSSLFFDHDLILAEINPLGITRDNNLLCLDAKLNVDNNALFRHPSLLEIYDYTQEDIKETQARILGLSYVPLEGNIGCMVNGAGLAMATMDIIEFYGGKAANFLDIGGNATKENIIKSFEFILSDCKVKAILINIFGGIVCCDMVAKSIISAISINNSNCVTQKNGINTNNDYIVPPIIVRLEGNKANIGKDRLIKSNLNIIIYDKLEDAVQYAVSIVR